MCWDAVEKQSFAAIVAYVGKTTLFQWNIDNFENETWRLKNGKLCNRMTFWGVATENVDISLEICDFMSGASKND